MKKYTENSSYLIVGLIFVIVGIFTLIGSVSLFKNISNILLILMILKSIKDLLEFLIKREKNKIKLISKIFAIIITILAYIFIEYSIAIIPILFSIYMIINGILGNLVEYILYKINKVQGGIKELMLGLGYLIIGLIVLFSPLIHLEFVLTILGIYSILLGISYLFDYLELKHYKKFPRIKICLPTIIEALIPLSVLQKFNKLINENNDEDIYIKKKNNNKPDLEILIHVTENGFGRLGHMDICFDDEIISFGNYDNSTYRLFEGTGSGILFFTKNRNKYIKFCIENSHKTLFVFGLKLNEKEKNDIRKNISKIKENLIEWYPPYLENKKKNIFTKKKEFTDYASKLYKKTKAKFYKFKTGKYKLYFVLGNNCVSLANKIIGKSLKDSFKFYGIMTPGTYYDYLEREFMKKNSIVVTKKIYNKNNMNKLK